MWLRKPVVFTDPLTLPAGLQVEVFDEARDGKRFKSDDLHAARDCASRVTRETGHRAVICAIKGVLRVLPREYLTDIKPGSFDHG